jgi:hypothetical protein
MPKVRRPIAMRDAICKRWMRITLSLFVANFALWLAHKFGWEKAYQALYGNGIWACTVVSVLLVSASAVLLFVSSYAEKKSQLLEPCPGRKAAT